MRSPLYRATALVAIAAAGLSVEGCSHNKRGADLPYVARDVGTLYSAARKRLDQRQYKEAAQLFDEVERQHPYSIWARRAQLMSAFSYYLDSDYTNSIQSAQRFLSVHPGNRDAAYAYYLIALGYYEQINDVTRDQKISGQALDALGELTRRYPNSKYAADARLKIDLVRDHLAGKEMEVGRFYERRGQWMAANGRFRKVIEEYQTTTHTPEALARLTETYMELGVPAEAEKAAAVLGANYPGTEWYAHAYKIMKAHPPEPIAPLARGERIVPNAAAVAPKGPPGEGTGPTPKGGASAPGAPTPTSTEGGAGASGGSGTPATGSSAQPST